MVKEETKGERDMTDKNEVTKGENLPADGWLGREEERAKEEDRSLVGMYGGTPRVKIGKFSICRQDDHSVWIEGEGGEGGSFPDDLFEAALKDFFNKYF